MTRIDTTGFDFLDLGCSPDSMAFAIRALGGRRGLGLDLSPERVKEMESARYACIEGDVLRLEVRPGSVRFVSISHVLEHLRGPDDVREVLARARDAATDFLFLAGPNFDQCEYLRAHGLKFFWADWIDHSYHLTTPDLRRLLADLGLSATITGGWRVRDSGDAAVHPLTSPSNQDKYDEKIHPPKPHVAFDRPVYQEFAAFVPLRPQDGWADLVRARHGCELVEPLSLADHLVLDAERLRRERWSIAEWNERLQKELEEKRDRARATWLDRIAHRVMGGNRS